MRINTILFSIMASLFFTACGGGDNAASTKEQVQKAAAGDEVAMRDLEKQVVEKAKAEKNAIAELGAPEKQAKQFYWDLVAGKINEDALRKLTGEDENIHAQVYTARTVGRRDNLAGADRKLFIEWLEHIATVDKSHLYYALNGGKYPLAGEAAFMISEDYLNAKWLYPTDTVKALTWLQKAADAGQPEAMYKLAIRYQYGLDVSEDVDTANMWMKKSADAGWRAASDALKN